MSTLSDQVQGMAQQLENLTPFSHVARSPWNRGYQRIPAQNGKQPHSTQDFRCFSISIQQQQPAAIAGTELRAFEVKLTIRVLYPLSTHTHLVEQYFSAECDLFRKELEDTAHYASPLVRLVQHVDSDIDTLEEPYLRFQHRFYLLVDEPA